MSDIDAPLDCEKQGGAEPSEAHNLDTAGSTPAPATNETARVDFSRFINRIFRMDMTCARCDTEVHEIKAAIREPDGSFAPCCALCFYFRLVVMNLMSRPEILN